MTDKTCVVCNGSLAENANEGNKSIGWLEGNNPWPLGSGDDKSGGRACDACNDAKVVPARILQRWKEEATA